MGMLLIRRKGKAMKSLKQIEGFETGAVVRLKSGGPAMTVNYSDESDQSVHCYWFTKDRQVVSDAFCKDMLIACEPDF